jgi:hypothetical protein
MDVKDEGNAGGHRQRKLNTKGAQAGNGRIILPGRERLQEGTLGRLGLSPLPCSIGFQAYGSLSLISSVHTSHHPECSLCFLTIPPPVKTWFLLLCIFVFFFPTVKCVIPTEEEHIQYKCTIRIK